MSEILLLQLRLGAKPPQCSKRVIIRNENVKNDLEIVPSH